ncbi:hypothetical protein LRP88_11577 [Fusarium phalaenopsidis]
MPSLPNCGSLKAVDDADHAVARVHEICFIGAGYVGGPAAAVMAFQNPDIKVTVVDRDVARIRRWNSRRLPIYEPDLSHIVRIARDGSRATSIDAPLRNDSKDKSISIPSRAPNLSFSTCTGDVIGRADIIVISVNTPTKEWGFGAGSATDMANVEDVSALIARYAQEGAIIVEKSTVPCRTAELIADTLAMHRPGIHFDILSNPEFLSAGSAIHDLLFPDRILIGSAPTASGRRAAETLAKIYNAPGWVPRNSIQTIGVWSSELAKLVANAMLAQRISSINSISAVCEKTGADVDEVARAVGIDPRIGDKFLTAGIGFGGSCFKKDVSSLVYLAETLKLPEVAEYWRHVIDMNRYARDRFSGRIIKCLNNTLIGKKICILGFVFKKDTSETREAPALEMIQTLLEEQPREIGVYDPHCDPVAIRKEIKNVLGYEVLVYDDPYDACDGSTALIIATDFDQFRTESRLQAPIPVKRSSTNRTPDPRPFCTNNPTLTELFILHKHLVGASASHDPLGLFNNEPDYDDDHTDSIPGKRGEKATGQANAHERVKRIDWVRITQSMAMPRWIFDGRGIIDPRDMAKFGVRVESVGRQYQLS